MRIEDAVDGPLERPSSRVRVSFYFPSLDPALFDLDPSSTKFFCFYS